MDSYVGIDFGTTNSAIAIADDRGDVRLVPLRGDPFWRTVLYFEPGGGLTAGAAAIARYVETDGDGRLVQSIKSHLASAAFTRTTIFGRRWTIEEMIAAYLRQLRAAAAPVELGRRCVIGRPVRYWGAENSDDDTRAVGRMTDALALAGFDEVVFEHEPVGAAARYAATLARDELICVADFGGGTTDFSVIRAGPPTRSRAPGHCLGGSGRARVEVLATGGIGVSGDAFDARVIDAIVAPALGRGTQYRDEMGGEAPVPAWLYGHLRRWHLLSFLKEDKTRRLLERVARGAIERERVARLVQVVEDDLGLELHRAVEGAKVRLSDTDVDTVRFTVASIGLALSATRPAFDDWIADDLSTIDRTLDDVLARAGTPASSIDRVFATGGSSLVPAVRAWLAARFGAERIVGGNELTSVAWGLAVRAREKFAGT